MKPTQTHLKMIAIETYKEQYKEDFIRLNKEWIERFFRLEESDLRTFANIDSYIVGNGGQIFMAIDQQTGEAVGCCALINHPDKQCYELAKMAVSPRAQGQHIGYELGRHLLAYAKEIGVKRIYLEGNTRLVASINLYRKLGFAEVPLEGNAYDRCDIIMEVRL